MSAIATVPDTVYTAVFVIVVVAVDAAIASDSGVAVAAVVFLCAVDAVLPFLLLSFLLLSFLLLLLSSRRAKERERAFCFCDGPAMVVVAHRRSRRRPCSGIFCCIFVEVVVLFVDFEVADVELSYYDCCRCFYCYYYSFGPVHDRPIAGVCCCWPHR